MWKPWSIPVPAISTSTQAVPPVLVLGLLVWVVLALRTLNGEKEGRIGKAVEALLAGLVLIDASVVGFYEPQVALLLLAAFLVALGLQRVVPAT